MVTPREVAAARMSSARQAALKSPMPPKHKRPKRGADVLTRLVAEEDLLQLVLDVMPAEDLCRMRVDRALLAQLRRPEFANIWRKHLATVHVLTETSLPSEPHARFIAHKQASLRLRHILEKGMREYRVEVKSSGQASPRIERSISLWR